MATILCDGWLCSIVKPEGCFDFHLIKRNSACQTTQPATSFPHVRLHQFSLRAVILLSMQCGCRSVIMQWNNRRSHVKTWWTARYVAEADFNRLRSCATEIGKLRRWSAAVSIGWCHDRISNDWPKSNYQTAESHWYLCFRCLIGLTRGKLGTFGALESRKRVWEVLERQKGMINCREDDNFKPETSSMWLVLSIQAFYSSYLKHARVDPSNERLVAQWTENFSNLFD